MKTIAFSIQKGGVGKSSLSVSLAAELARETGSVLLIDADPQGSASGWIGPREVNRELADVLFGKIDLAEALWKTTTPGLSLLPTAGLDGDLNLYSKTLASQQDRCIKKVAQAAAAQGFRYCILDMSPAFGPLEWACFMAADEVITPVLPDSFAADGLEVFAGNLAQFRADKETDKPFYRRVIVNALDKRIPQHGDTLAKVKRQQALTIYEFPVDPAFRKGQYAGLTVQGLTGTKPETMAELKRLASDILQEG
ncbi:MAG: ParA family protein [Treponema sp.]|nr:ParA family protein [Treponema sp.]